MKIGFYPRLAWTGIRKNKRLYTPYILTCIGMVMMHYIMAFLQYSPVLELLPGSGTLETMLGLGSWVISIFAVIFLFYTHSFLIRRRKKEFGLYNILGMGKGNIGRILIWETLMISVLALVIGLIAGAALSKIAELGLVNLMNGEISYGLSVSFQAIGLTGRIFIFIFVLIFFNGLIQVYKTNAIELLHSENVGEKPPRANWLLGLSGAVLLAAAYWLALSIEEPISALIWFFAAVIMVIIATYLLFIAGSVLLCRILQKKKNYYYKPDHFVAVSSMAYRMKRNGAGLASICILGTMVLVMLASTTCLYFGTESSLRNRYPRDINVDITLDSLRSMESVNGEENTDGEENKADIGAENIEFLRTSMEQIVLKQGVSADNVMDYRYAVVTGILRNGALETDVRELNSFDMDTYDQLYQVYFVPLSDYNRMMGADEQLAEDETMVYVTRDTYEYDTFTIQKGTTYQITKVLTEFAGSGYAAMDILPSIFVIVPDFEKSIEPLLKLTDYNGEQMLRLKWSYGFDTAAEEAVQIQVKNQIQNQLRTFSIEREGGIDTYSCESLEENRDDFLGTYGGLFFLGIILSVVFLAATVLIIYYKQISEGYEDQARFEIMQKVGMTKKDIRKSINSQMLTVFFLPLFTAVLHLAFAFPLIRKLLMLFNLTDLRLLLTTTGISVLVFAVFYMAVYKITSHVYFSIVSGARVE